MNQIRNQVLSINALIGALRTTARPTFEQTLGVTPFSKEDSVIEYLDTPTFIYVFELIPAIQTELLLTIWEQEGIFQIRDLMLRTPEGIVNPIWRGKETTRHMKEDLMVVRKLLGNIITELKSKCKLENMRGEDLIYVRPKDPKSFDGIE